MSRARLGKLLLLSAAGTLAAGVVALLPTLVDWSGSTLKLLVPGQVRGWLPLAGVAALAAVLAARPARLAGVRVAPAFWEATERASAWWLNGPLTALVAAAGLAMLAGWVPHYLTWPWWADLDHFGVAALSWDAGLAPYRDRLDYNFPGPTYVMWLLGKTAGWGRTAPAYAFDAGTLLALGAAEVAWSRRVFGRALPGALGYVAFLGYYLSLDCAQVAQRDWYSTVLVVLGLFALEAWPGRRGRLASALAFGLASSFRPYTVLFLPAIASAVGEGSGGRPRRAAGEWAVGAVLATALAFAPVWATGLGDDFLRNLRYLRAGGPYNQATPALAAERLLTVLTDWRPVWMLAALGFLAGVGPPRFAKTSRTWLLALAGAVVYKPVSPHAHDYLDIPITLILSVTLAVAAGAVLASETGRRLDATRLAAVVALGLAFVPQWPRFSEFGASARSVRAWATGRPTADPPPGNVGYQHPAGSRANYAWADYLAVLDYLRAHTTRRTLVANVLRNHPLPPVNGPAGRLSPFPAVAGLLWMRWLGNGLEGEFCRGLEAADDAVVVWSPDESAVMPNLALPGLDATIRRNYAFEARFGAFEVWRRKPRGVSRRGRRGAAPRRGARRGGRSRRA